jgi:hypothetical protein
MADVLQIQEFSLDWTVVPRIKNLGAQYVMDPLNKFASFAETLASRLAEQLTTTSLSIFSIVFIALCLFAVISMRVVTALGAILLAAVGYLLFVAPNSATVLIALGASASSLLLTISGIRSRRREKIRRRDFEILRHSIQNLESMAGRQFLQSLNPPSREIIETEKP